MCRASSVVGTGAGEPAHGDDAPTPAPELRSRGPPSAQCDSPGRRPSSRLVRVDPQSTKCPQSRRPGPHPTELLDPTTITNNNKRPIPSPLEGATGQVTANSVDRRTRESLIAHRDCKMTYEKTRETMPGTTLTRLPSGVDRYSQSTGPAAAGVYTAMVQVQASARPRLHDQGTAGHDQPCRSVWA